MAPIPSSRAMTATPVPSLSSMAKEIVDAEEPRGAGATGRGAGGGAGGGDGGGGGTAEAAWRSRSAFFRASLMRLMRAGGDVRLRQGRGE
jgi:hypothetical protein